jgi:UDP-glucose 4-epimerase
VYYEANLYAETKYKSEQVIKNSDHDYVILRLFNIYGERQKNGVVSIFCCASCENKKLFIHGDGSQTRDFVYVKDACKMFIKAMNPKYKKALWDVKTGRQTSVKQLAEMVKLETGIKKVVAHMRAK